jgi:hypothetical protein
VIIGHESPQQATTFYRSLDQPMIVFTIIELYRFLKLLVGFSDPYPSDCRLADHDGLRRRRGLHPLWTRLQLPVVILDPRRPQDRCHHGEQDKF